jgi:hypothetical protein
LSGSCRCTPYRGRREYTLDQHSLTPHEEENHTQQTSNAGNTSYAALFPDKDDLLAVLRDLTSTVTRVEAQAASRSASAPEDSASKKSEDCLQKEDIRIRAHQGASEGVSLHYWSSHQYQI